MGRTFKPDPKLTRPEHKWEFVDATKYPWGISAMFRCTNPGCITTIYLPLKPDPTHGGICFDRDSAIQIDPGVL